MNKKSQKRLVFALIIGILLIGIASLYFISAKSIYQEDEREIGYEIINETVHVWNTKDEYYFDKNSGMQFTNDYKNYWTKNVFCLGYYNGDEWIKIKCADELEDFNKQINSDNLTYVNATLWKDFSYQGYDFRMGIRYHLKLNDQNLSVIIYGKNIGQDIPFDLGFAWIVKEVDIPVFRAPSNDRIYINQTYYNINGTYNLIFKNMTQKQSYILRNNETNMSEEIFYYNPLSHYRLSEFTKYLTLDWDGGLNYAVKLFGNGAQEEFYIAVMINAGHFNPGQEKSTTFYWIDAEGDYVTSFDTAAAGFQHDNYGACMIGDYIGFPDYSDDLFYVFNPDGTLKTSWSTSGTGGLPTGCTYDGTYLWILNEVGLGQSDVYRYTLDENLDGTYDEFTFNLGSPYEYSGSMGSNSTTLFMSDEDRFSAFEYSNTGDFIKEHVFAIKPYGMTFFDGKFYIANTTAISKFHLDDTSNETFAKTGDNANANYNPITLNQSLIYIFDNADDEVYIYLGPGGGEAPPQPIHWADNGSIDQPGVFNCSQLNTTNGRYTLNVSVESQDSCFNITADNITLDCNGLIINYSSNGGTFENAVFTLKNGLTLKNCNIKEGVETGTDYNYGIYLWNSVNNTIYNNNVSTLSNQAYSFEGIGMNTSNISNNNFTTGGYESFFSVESTSDNNYIMNNFIHSKASKGYGLQMAGSSFNVVDNNIIITEGMAGYNIRLVGGNPFGSSNNNFTNNLQNSTGANNVTGVYIFLSSAAITGLIDNNTFINNKLNINGTGGGGIKYGYTPARDSIHYDTYYSQNNRFYNLSVISPLYYSLEVYEGKSFNFSIFDSIFNSSKPTVANISALTNGELNFTNVTQLDGSAIDFNWENGANGTVNVFWYLKINVTDSEDNPLENANITLRTSDNTFVLSELTDATGYISRKVIQDYKSVNGTLITYYSPHNITTNLTGYDINVTTVNLTNTLNTEVTIILQSSADTIYPTFLDNLTTPLNGTEYVENIKYELNITIKDINGTLGIDFNDINYSLTNISAVYNKTFSNLPAGVYSYYYWAYGNGTSNNYNISNTYSYTIASNSSLVLGLTATTPIEYQTDTDFTGSGCPSQLTCSLNITNKVYGAGTISANYSTAGNANYTPTSTDFTVTINKNSSYVLGITGTTPITYPTVTDVAGSGCPEELTCALDKTNKIYGVGTETFNYSTAGNANYTVNSVVIEITIEQATGELNGTINHVQNNYTAEYGVLDKNRYVNSTNITGYGTGKIYINGTLYNSGKMPIFNVTNLSLGYYNITFIYDGNTNYSSDTEVWWVNLTDNHYPTINITYPVKFINTTDTKIDVNYTRNDTNLDSCWYTRNDGITNDSLESCTNITGVEWTEGKNNITIWINDSANNVNYTSITFTLDTTNPNVSLIYPLNNTYNASTTQNITFNSSDSLGISNATLFIYNSTGMFNQTNVTFVSDTLSSVIGVTMVLVENAYNWWVQVWDWAGNTFISDNRTLIIDTTYPKINITSPNNNSWSNLYDQEVNYTFIETYVDSCWWSDDDGANNQSSSCLNLTGPWNAGENIIYIFINDSAGTVNSSEITLNIDAVNPLINMTSPRHDSYTSTQIEINFTITEANPDSCWYSTDAGATNITTDCNANVTGLTSSEGYNTWVIAINDSADNRNMSIFTFFVDSILPVTVIKYPSNISYNTNISQLNYTFIEANPDSCWWTNNSGEWNSTAIDCGNNWSDIVSEEGNNEWILYINDTLGNTNLTRVSFFVDTTVPSLNVTYPLDGGSYSFYGEINLTLNVSAEDASGIDTMWYNVQEYGGINYSFTNTTGMWFVVPEEEYRTFTINIYTNDSLNNVYSTTLIVTIVQLNPILGVSGGGSPSQGDIIGELYDKNQTEETVETIITETEQEKINKKVIIVLIILLIIIIVESYNKGFTKLFINKRKEKKQEENVK